VRNASPLPPNQSIAATETAALVVASFAFIVAASLSWTWAWPRVGGRNGQSVKVANHAVVMAGATQVYAGAVPVVVFMDYECLACKRLLASLDTVRNGGLSVRLLVRHLPLTDTHPEALGAAMLLECAALSGVAELIHRQLLAKEPGAPARVTLEHPPPDARPAALDSVRECARTGQSLARVESDIRLASSLGLSATPSILVGDRVHIGARSAPWLRRHLQ